MSWSTTRIIAVVGGALWLLVWALSHSLRLSWSDDWALMLRAQGPGVAAAFAVGAALGLSGALRPARHDSSYREFVLLAATAGAVAGMILGQALGTNGQVGSAVGLAAGCALIAWAIGRRHRAWLLLQAPLCLVATAVLLAASNYLRVASGGQQRVLGWLLGDLTHASWPAVLLLGGAVVGLGLRATGVLSGRATRESERVMLAWATLALGVGFAGPIAFVSALAAWFAHGVAKQHSPDVMALVSALAGAAALVGIEGLLRTLLGGFTWPLGPSVALLSGPAWLCLHAARLRRAGAPPRWVRYRYFEYALVLGVAALSLLALGWWVRLIRAFLT